MIVNLNTYLAFFVSQLWSFIAIKLSFPGNLMTTK